VQTLVHPAPAQQPDPVHIAQALALEFNTPVQEVMLLYEAQRRQLERGARIKSFLPIFAIRNVQDILRLRALSAQAPGPMEVQHAR
jgi:hypothetical protein